MLDDATLLTVTDLKQFSYCPRVVFYERCLPHIRPRTVKMDAGLDAHEAEPKRAVRRSLAGYDVLSGERRFDVRLTSATLQLTGIVDEVVYSSDGSIFPVDYKLAKQAGFNHRVQLTAYALLLEEVEHRKVERGYIYLMLSRKLVKVVISDQLRQTVTNQLAQMQTMISHEIMPMPPENHGLCMACEFRRFCNDV